jgi:hypothetical protein
VHTAAPLHARHLCFAARDNGCLCFVSRLLSIVLQVLFKFVPAVRRASMFRKSVVSFLSRPLTTQPEDFIVVEH